MNIIKIVFYAVTLIDVLVLLALFPTPVRGMLSKVFDMSDGSYLINFSLIFVIVNVIAFLTVFYGKTRGQLLDGQHVWLAYSCLSVISVYSIIGIIALFQMYVVGLK